MNGRSPTMVNVRPLTRRPRRGASQSKKTRVAAAAARTMPAL